MKNFISKLFFACALSSIPCSLSHAEETFAGLSVYPTEIKMSTSAAYQNIVAVATRTDGVTVDVTDQVEWKLAEPSLAKLENFQLKPLADGQTKLIASWKGFTAETPLTVADAAKPRRLVLLWTSCPCSLALVATPVHVTARPAEKMAFACRCLDSIHRATINASPARLACDASTWPSLKRA